MVDAAAAAAAAAQRPSLKSMYSPPSYKTQQEIESVRQAYMFVGFEVSINYSVVYDQGLVFAGSYLTLDRGLLQALIRHETEMDVWEMGPLMNKRQ